jgi:branched-chain amino acid transport system substrate-binding protein
VTARRALAAIFVLLSSCSWLEDDVVIGAIYPVAGSQGSGGVEEFRGLRLAADLANQRGGIDGRPVRLRLLPAESSDAAPEAVRRLAEEGASVVVGSYGSTISLPAAEAATRAGVVFWETGAVGEMGSDAASGDLVFRFAPTGRTLGREAVRFVSRRLLRSLAAVPDTPRYTVTYVDDEYGRSVGLGAIEEIRRSGLRLAGAFPYRLHRVDYDRLARRIGRAGTDVLVVAAYMEDAVAMRRALLEHDVQLLAGIGTSSSYCHPEFGAALGRDAVGLFASDKPDGANVEPSALSSGAAEALRWARAEYRRRYAEPMSAAALTGFSGGWALFHHVLPRAESLDPAAVAEAVLAARVPRGGLPNASGLGFAPAGQPDAGANLRAATVIWEWVKPETRAVVWPPALATSALVPLVPR